MGLDFESGQLPIGVNEIGASGLIDEAQLLDEDVTLFMGHRFRDPLLEDWADFGWIQHAQIIDRQLRLLTLKKHPVVYGHKARICMIAIVARGGDALG